MATGTPVTPPAPNPAARLADAYRRLAAAATELNTASDQFGKPVAEIEQALGLLNLGVEAWEKVRGQEDEQTGEFWTERIGYAKWQRHWRICITTVRGNNHTVETYDDDTWPFSEAPRSLRIAAVDKLPDLVEKLVIASEKTSRKMVSKVNEVQQMAAALAKVASEVQKSKRVVKS